MTLRLLAVSAAILFAPALAAHARTIDFETGAPLFFDATDPLTTAYASQGVTFSGVDGAGGSILDQGSGFGIEAHSGVDFLAFNTLALTGQTEKVSFSSPESAVSLYVGDGVSQTYTATAFDAMGKVVGIDSVTPDRGVYGELSIDGAGITSVEFSGGATFVADDLSFTNAPISAAPEPSGWALMFAGVAVIAGTLRLGRCRESGAASLA